MSILSLLTEKQKESLYLDWANNFLTVASFAEHYGLDIDHAENFINTYHIDIKRAHALQHHYRRLNFEGAALLTRLMIKHNHQRGAVKDEINDLYRTQQSIENTVFNNQLNYMVEILSLSPKTISAIIKGV